jgi:prepilin peptidase dependent protein B
MLSRKPYFIRSKMLGFSLIELMVGIAVGMVVVAGASMMMTNQLAEHRRLTLETQVQQDLRATADLMLRDLRRAGSRAAPQNGIWAPSAAAASNAYADINLAADQDGSVLQYSYSRHQDRSRPDADPLHNPDPEDDVMTTSTERFGFRIEDGGILKFRIGDRWQPLTDKGVLVITAFNVVLAEQQVGLGDLCSEPCPVGSTTCPPSQRVRRYDLSLTGHAAHDIKVERTIKVTSRIRNDQIVGACP